MVPAPVLSWAEVGRGWSERCTEVGVPPGAGGAGRGAGGGMVPALVLLRADAGRERSELPAGWRCTGGGVPSGPRRAGVEAGVVLSWADAGCDVPLGPGVAGRRGEGGMVPAAVLPCADAGRGRSEPLSGRRWAEGCVPPGPGVAGRVVDAGVVAAVLRSWADAGPGFPPGRGVAGRGDGVSVVSEAVLPCADAGRERSEPPDDRRCTEGCVPPGVAGRGTVCGTGLLGVPSRPGPVVGKVSVAGLSCAALGRTRSVGIAEPPLSDR